MCKFTEEFVRGSQHQECGACDVLHTLSSAQIFTQEVISRLVEPEVRDTGLERGRLCGRCCRTSPVRSLVVCSIHPRAL